MPTEGPLDQEITESELTQAVKELKNNKATGPDKICNEILKCESEYLFKALLHLFNVILKNGNYPKNWLCNIVTPYTNQVTYTTHKIIEALLSPIV